MLRVHVRASVRPTEDPARVRQAVLNLFPDARLEETRDAVSGEAASLDRLAELVRNHQIPDTARNVMLRGRSGEPTRTRFVLGKQAAYAGRPNVGVQPGPLGEIEVTIEAASERELLEAIYAVGFDTTVPAEWARVPREYRPEEAPDTAGFAKRLDERSPP